MTRYDGLSKVTNPNPLTVRNLHWLIITEQIMEPVYRLSIDDNLWNLQRALSCRRRRLWHIVFADRSEIKTSSGHAFVTGWLLIDESPGLVMKPTDGPSRTIEGAVCSKQGIEVMDCMLPEPLFVLLQWTPHLVTSPPLVTWDFFFFLHHLLKSMASSYFHFGLATATDMESGICFDAKAY